MRPERQRPPRVVNAPKVDLQLREVAKNLPKQLETIQMDTLRDLNRKQADPYRELLKKSVEFLTHLDIFPTIEYTDNRSEEKIQEKLLFVCTEQDQNHYSENYFLNPHGELIVHSRSGNQIYDVHNRKDLDYIEKAPLALYAIEKTIEEAL